MAGGPLQLRLPRASTSGANPNYRYPSGDAVADFYETGGGAPRVGGGFETVDFDDGFKEALADMSPDLFAKYEAEDVAPKGGFVGSKIPWAHGGDWVTAAPSMAPWLKKKRVS